MNLSKSDIKERFKQLDGFCHMLLCELKSIDGLGIGEAGEIVDTARRVIIKKVVDFKKELANVESLHPFDPQAFKTFNKNIVDKLIREVDLDDSSRQNITSINKLAKNPDNRLLFVANHVSELDFVMIANVLEKQRMQDIHQRMITLVGEVVKKDPLKFTFASSVSNNLFIPNKIQDNGEMLGSMRALLKKYDTSQESGTLLPITALFPAGGRRRPFLGEDLSQEWQKGMSLTKSLIDKCRITHIVPFAIDSSFINPVTQQAGESEQNFLLYNPLYLRVTDPVEIPQNIEKDKIDRFITKAHHQVEAGAHQIQRIHRQKITQDTREKIDWYRKES